MIDDSHARFAVKITLDVMGGCCTLVCQRTDAVDITITSGSRLEITYSSLSCHNYGGIMG